MKRLVMAAVLALPGAAAQADWSFVPPAAADDLGAARVGDGRVTLTVGCGNAGFVSLSLTPDPRPANPGLPADLEFGFVVDGGAWFPVPFECRPEICTQSGVIEAGPMSGFVAALRAGTTLEVWSEDLSVGRFSLRGSAAALSALRQSAAFCDGL